MHIFGRKQLKKWIACRLEQKIRDLRPDAIVFIGAFLMPQELFDVLKKFPNIKKAGWCGDKFDTSCKSRADCLDILFCTDYGFKQQADTFNCKFVYLPLCAKVTQNYTNKKTLPPFFAGGLNSERKRYLSAIQSKCLLYLLHCPKGIFPQHEVHYHAIPHELMLKYIGQSICPINIGLSVNNISGLNFRVFETGACGGLIMVNSECTDISKCYFIGTEAVVYSSPEQLNDLVTDATAHPEKYEKIAKAGYERTLQEHTYEKRIQQMLAFLQQS